MLIPFSEQRGFELLRILLTCQIFFKIKYQKWRRLLGSSFVPLPIHFTTLVDSSTKFNLIMINKKPLAAENHLLKIIIKNLLDSTVM